MQPSKRRSKISRGLAKPKRPIRVCFVTGTRAEFGLMVRVLLAIQQHPSLSLQLIVTGMHLHAAHGRSINAIRKAGWKIDAVIPWKAAGNNATILAEQSGLAISKMARAFDRLKSDIVLVTGDRVEAFAAASAAHISGKVLAHVHGGDRAPGQIDDSLRHAISKLAHIHFPATKTSAGRLLKLGEDKGRIHVTGSPGIDNISEDALPKDEIQRLFPRLRGKRFALIVFHPVSSSNNVEYQRAKQLLTAVRRVGIEQTVVVFPNNDPGSGGIIRCWREHQDRITYLLSDAPRQTFLGLLRDADVLLGNSSSGIIEAASFGTFVLDIGPRQSGRERSGNVASIPYDRVAITSALQTVWGRTQRRWRGHNVYGGRDTGKRIAVILSELNIEDQKLRRKLIAY